VTATGTRTGALAARWMRPLAVASLVATIGIVVTGGAVRLTASGLGCPSWPRCTEESFVPHGAIGWHGAIEFGNRMVTFVLAAIAILTWVAAMRREPRERSVRRVATVLALGIPGQAVIGGFTVLTDLNPWIVGLHLMLSMVLISASVLLLHLLADPTPGSKVPAVRRLAIAAYAVAFVVLYLGTVVTGSGPHAGDLDAPRNRLDPETWSHVHAWFVYLLVGLTLGLVATMWRVRERGAPLHAAYLLLAVEVVQGGIGFTQYYLDLPEMLVGLHLLGAALLAASVTHLVLRVVGTPGSNRGPNQVPDQRTASIATETKSNAR
jgi:cytochrome c oxidase assembly protein subunit 15